jgi:hypothetical protein
MKLQDKTLEKLRNLINEEIDYKSGHKLVNFFNNLGFNDSYGQGFPSRWVYTDEKLQSLNGTPELDKCIREVFAPVNFVGKFYELDEFISQFNQYLAFDGWNIFRKGKEISFRKVTDNDVEEQINSNFSNKTETSEEQFLEQDFKNISIEKLKLDGVINEVLNQRIEEIQKCLQVKSSLAVIFLCGSTLEGILLGFASKNSKAFNQSKCSPKNQEGKVKSFQDWNLSNLIDVARSLGLIGEDVKKFSHALRDFRNYIHPYQQMGSGFFPDEHTSKICWQVLQATISQLSK